MEVDEGSDQKSDIMPPLDCCACVFEERIYGGQKVPKSHELAQMGLATSSNSIDYGPLSCGGKMGFKYTR